MYIYMYICMHENFQNFVQYLCWHGLCAWVRGRGCYVHDGNQYGGGAGQAYSSRASTRTQHEDILAAACRCQHTIYLWLNRVRSQSQVATKRVFVTVELNDKTAQQVDALVANLRDSFPLDRKQLDSVVRWVEPDAMHITLHTLEVQVPHLDRAQELLTQAVRELDLASFTGRPSRNLHKPYVALSHVLGHSLVACVF